MKIIVLKFGGTSVGTTDRIKKVARIIAKSMNKKYFAPPLPPIIMRIVVGWELGEQLGLNSIRAIPKKLLEKGFVFKNTTLDTMKEDFINE